MNTTAYLFLVLLLGFGLAQHGGGGHGGGGHSGGSHSSTSGQSCATQCEHKNTNQFQIKSCKDKCPGFFGILATISVIGVTGMVICFIFDGCVQCCRKSFHFVLNKMGYTVEQPDSKQMQLLQSKPVELTEREFQTEAKRLIQEGWAFYFTQNGLKFQVVDYKLDLLRQSQNHYQIAGKGSDKYGFWTLEGQYVYSQRQGITILMQKQYEDKDRAGQIGKWQTLIYEGKMNEQRNYTGKWYFKGFENDSQYSGTWEMFKANQTVNGTL